MLQSFILMVATSLWTLGLSYASEEEMLLHPYRLLAERLGWWGKPLLTCVYCMPSVHGLLICTAFHVWHHSLPNPVQYVFVAAGAVALNMLVASQVEVLRWKAAYYSNLVKQQEHEQKSLDDSGTHLAAAEPRGDA